MARKLNFLFAVMFVWVTAVSAQTLPGLNMTFAAADAGHATDVVATSNVWLYVGTGESASPFLPVGSFTVTWDGFVKADRRGNYGFRAELNGAFTLEINGQTVLEARTNGVVEAAKPVALNKGTNKLVARFTSSAQGEAFVRLEWKPKDEFFSPLPSDRLTRTADFPGAKDSAQLHRGRELFLEYRCAKCHSVSAAAVPELSMDAPSFEGIGSRLNYEWMSRWIESPKSLRLMATMPKVLHGASVKQDAEAIATFLASFKTGAATVAEVEPSADSINGGKRLFDVLHCAACHNAPDTTEADAAKISFKFVRQKFAAGALTEFLQKPEAHYAWIRMPNFKLSANEAGLLAAYLVSTADNPIASVAPDMALLEHGKQLVQTSGCLNCHALKLDNQFTAPSLAGLSADKWSKGCIAATSNSRAPDFSFSADERAALQAFAATDRASLVRHVPAEFAERQSRTLNCRECHGKFEGFPTFDILGGKLKPEWARAFIAGEIAYKPRPWLEARMPSFASRAELLARGLAKQQGYPPQTATEPPVDAALAKIGATLISTMPGQGLSCVACHAVGEASASLTFESPGLNFTHAGERLRKTYFQHWVRNPQLIDPATKMPVYFDDENKSPLTGVLDGNVGRQLDAVWEYFRLGEKMPPPPKP